MSQAGLLTEDEVREFIDECFGLKLERDALLRPTQDVVITIYSKFLDAFIPNWRQPRDFPSELVPSTKLLIVKLVKRIASNYEQTHDFTIYDLLNPNRKRTTVFLNVLIFVKLGIDEKIAYIQGEIDRRRAHHESYIELERESAELRLQLEEKAIKKATSQSIEEIREEKKKAKAKFQYWQGKMQTKDEEVEEMKASIKALESQVEQEQEKYDLTLKQLTADELTLRMLNDGRKTKNQIANAESQIEALKDKVKFYELLLRELRGPQSQSVVQELVQSGRQNELIPVETEREMTAWRAAKMKLADLEANKTKLVLEYQIEEDESRNDIEKKSEIRDQLRKEYNKKIEEVKEKIQGFEDDIIKQDAQAKEISHASDDIKNKVKNELASLMRKSEVSYNKSIEASAIVAGNQERIDNFFKQATTKPISSTGNNANRTYTTVANQTYDVNK